MVVCASWAGLSISETAFLQGFLRITVSKIYREWSEIQIEKKNTQ